MVKETEEQESDADSEDNVPIATVLSKTKQCKLTLDQIQDCQEGPKDEKAIGVTVAKKFDGVEYRGIVDSWRSARKRSYYHVTYTDGDEEELSQIELRVGFLAGLSDDLKAEWKLYSKGSGQTPTEDFDKETEQDSNEAMSDGEGSLYDKDSDEDIIAKYQTETQRKRKETRQQTIKKMGPKPKTQTMAGLVLP